MKQKKSRQLAVDLPTFLKLERLAKATERSRVGMLRVLLESYERREQERAA